MAEPRNGQEPDDEFELRITRGELSDLHSRLIATETVLVTLLAIGGEEARAAARRMADYIRPRPGTTPHELTLDAATHVEQLVDRAGKAVG